MYPDSPTRMATIRTLVIASRNDKSWTNCGSTGRRQRTEGGGAEGWAGDAWGVSSSVRGAGAAPRLQIMSRRAPRLNMSDRNSHTSSGSPWMVLKASASSVPAINAARKARKASGPATANYTLRCQVEARLQARRQMYLERECGSLHTPVLPTITSSAAPSPAPTNVLTKRVSPRRYCYFWRGIILGGGGAC
jgi:hypothetical protein